MTKIKSGKQQDMNQENSNGWNPKRWSPAEITGVLGFVLALALGVVKFIEWRQSIFPSIRIGAIEFKDDYKDDNGNKLVDIVVPVYHEIGRSVHIETIQLTGDYRDNRSGINGSWGLGRGLFTVGNRFSLELYLCNDLDCNNFYEMVNYNYNKVAIIEEGQTQYWLGRARFIEVMEIGSLDKTQNVKLEIWSQGKVVKRFDVFNEFSTWASSMIFKNGKDYKGTGH